MFKNVIIKLSSANRLAFINWKAVCLDNAFEQHKCLGMSRWVLLLCLVYCEYECVCPESLQTDLNDKQCSKAKWFACFLFCFSVVTSEYSVNIYIYARQPNRWFTRHWHRCWWSISLSLSLSLSHCQAPVSQLTSLYMLLNANSALVEPTTPP